MWNTVRLTFLGSALLFLINIYFGFDNALTPVSQGIPRWQLLMHLHAGTIGWITLSVIGASIWFFTGDRDVTRGYARGVRGLAGAGIFVFFGYVVSFGIAFSRGGAAFALLPVFGTLAAAVIWTTAGFVILQARRLPTVSTVHILLVAALAVVSLGALMGVMLGLERVIGEFLPNLPADDRVGVHAGAMDVYLFLAASAIIEAFVAKDPGGRWTRSGATQAGAWGIAGILVPLFMLGGLPPELILIFVILLFLGLGVFLARMARQALGRLPVDASPQSWAFFGTVWLIIFSGIFVYAAIVILPDIANAPRWFGAVFQHSNFVGMTTNTLLGLYTARAVAGSLALRRLEGLSMGLINLGLAIFFLLEIFADIRLGAVVMGIGVLLAVLLVIYRLGSEGMSARGSGGTVPG